MPRTVQTIEADVPVVIIDASMGGVATLDALVERPKLITCRLTFSVYRPFAG